MDSPFFPLPNGSAPQFTCTNESLDAIMAGLEPKKGDTILAVGGSGDQAFAMLESDARVVVVDFEPEQIAFIEHRKEALSRGDYWTFARRAHIATDAQPDFGVRLVERDDYFKDSERLQRMHENLGNLTVLPPADVFEAVTRRAVVFSKVYLSNASTFNGITIAVDIIASFVSALPLRTMVYFSDGGPIYLSGGDMVSLPSSFKLDEEHTLRARTLEQATLFYPSVYEKVA